MWIKIQVLIIVYSKGQYAFLGIGFPERSSAFDFQIALQDFTRSSFVENKPKETCPKLDFSLKQGQTISLSIGNTKASKNQKQNDTNIENCNFLYCNFSLYCTTSIKEG